VTAHLAVRSVSNDKSGMKKPDILSKIVDLRKAVHDWRAESERVAFVPTMGALHAGHVSLVEIAQKAADRTIVSIFINPKQFAAGEDYHRYPRTLDADLWKLGEAGVDAVFVPEVYEIYPIGFATSVSIVGPATASLEDRFRPTHFQGVATVVAKLLIAAEPDVAIFGEKDFQQLQVIRRMALDLALPVEIVGAPIARDANGLALSSRNAYLSEAERGVAPALNAALRNCADRLENGEPVADALDAARAETVAAGFVLDYLELRDAETLAVVKKIDERPCRLLAAAYLGRTRLIDNVAILGLNDSTERRDFD
jgi:pantoate--beta-alanine ligase